MSEQPSLPALPKLVVQLTDDEPAFPIATRQSDMLLWEETSHKHKWPSAADAPFLLSWFLAWAALRRTGKLPANMAKWEDFKANAVGVGPDNSEPAGAVFPTGPAPATG